MPRKTGLGRGLDALLPDVETTLSHLDSPDSSDPRDAVIDIPIHAIDPNPNQPRRTFDPDTLSALSASIQTSGILSPILVARDGSRYTIIAGERRWRAARLANLTTIPAIVRDWDEIKRQEAALIENIQRDDLNPIEEAQGIARLIDQYSFTQEAIAERLGKSRPAVTNLLRLLTLPDFIQKAITDGTLSAGHARVLAGVTDADIQKMLFEKTISLHWSVRQLETAARDAAKTREEEKPKPELPVEYTELGDALRNATGLKVHISGSREKGKVVLEYNDPESLQKLWDLVHA
ncbi:MAG: ParB/RepB/Spo0J family partition protein [Clostridia bacterium]|nr:ParB/RepB/Spo0J family partition protein [Clostridia bacterium]